MVFQVMSYLPASDLLTVKLVSRRFYTLVTSPLAWMNAFARFFRGSETLRGAREDSSESSIGFLGSEQRLFSRLSSSASWSSEYLIRTRLLRCLMRGRPSLPFAAPNPGKPGKGSATFTFSSRLTYGCSNMHADFGSPFDKRKPQFIHGIASTGSVTSSDRKGKFDSWGFTNRVAFRHFAETHPGFAPYGMGLGDILGMPNMMDVSQSFGVVYGEGTPGGGVFYLSTDEKHGRYLAPFSGLNRLELGFPRIMQDLQVTCSLWIAKSLAIPRITNGLIGILSGSSCGVVSAYSPGPQGNRDRNYGRGQLTARWLLSPGVPIIALFADDNYSAERSQRHRIWAVALNALSELFYLTMLPTQASTPLQEASDIEVAEEVRAWQTGKSATWKLAASSRRTDRYTDASSSDAPEYLPSSCWPAISSTDKENSETEARRLQKWISKSPGEIRSAFEAWDMRRRLDIDFANESGDGSGEVAIITTCGFNENEVASITRYTRAKAVGGSSSLSAEAQTSQGQASTSPGGSPDKSTSWSFAAVDRKQFPEAATSASIDTLRPYAELSEDEWRVSSLGFGTLRVSCVTTTAMDGSSTALITAWEDEDMRSKLRTRHPSKNPGILQHQIPGQRARFLAAGTSAGLIFLWNGRASSSTSTVVVSDIKPVRVIRTDSPGISSLALTALYLVHGGEEGLVQAWDPLASTMQPLRTLSSRHAINNRRRAVLVAQQNPAVNAPPFQQRHSLAAGALCLDPDPTVLRGIVAIGGYLKYWSYSPFAADEDLTRSQKRRLKRGSGRGSNSGAFLEGVSFSSTGRRANVKNFVTQELHQRTLDERERRKDAKEDRRVAGRFGLDLLGPDASEEELIAYAKLLSEEENERQLQQAAAAELKLRTDSGEAVIEAHKSQLSDTDAEKWKYASWQERFEMLPEGGVALPRSGPRSTTTAQTSSEDYVGSDPDLQHVMDLSIREQREREREQLANVSSSSPIPGPSTINYDADPDLAEAIALSLTHDHHSSPPLLSPESRTPSRSIAHAGGKGRKPATPRSSSRNIANHDDDLKRAIRLSLQDTGPDVEPALDEDAFPALGGSSSPISGAEWNVARGGKGQGKGKGKKRG